MIAVVSVWIGAVAAILTPIVYGLGSRWWTNYWGRTLFTKDVVIGLAYLRSVSSLVGHPLPDSVPWYSWALGALMAVALVANLVVMVVVTKRGRKR